ncbi:uncharacterized protein ColSpa_03795 [Colletotrichum spaethianum]|uniref:C6 transcription factor n=1 Tax=Colletotrichum spaethianum TaxID=700344 RepID=A0AA37LAB1_9PEZI|nr:uncharacterized protein ColSpa_03795 [Colletotrichum spaethianum]GKT43614.1 hypothetical protein ColSpa_03795 [Colletotrichum spaethianum]
MARFSFTDFQGCSIATIIVLLAGILHRDSGYEGRVAFGLDCLRQMACGRNPTARTGVRFVEALQSITNEARSKLLATDLGPENRPGASAGEADEYGRWAEWLANAETIHDLSSDESDLEQAEESTCNAVNAPTMQQTPWDEAAAFQLQDISASGFDLVMDQSAAPNGQNMMASLSAEDTWLPSFTWNDDHMQLMGLAGMDILDFTDLF